MKRTPPVMRRSLRALAHLLSYPHAELRAHAAELHEAIEAEAALPAARRSELAALVRELQRGDGLALEAAYVELFDRGRRTSLHLFEHVHGDSRDRGPAMIDLQQTYAKAGLHLHADELPDHLSVVLEFASTQPPAVARDFLAEMADILAAIFTALQQRESRYASVMAAVIELSGGKAQAVDLPLAEEESLDASWAEPEAFGGCSTRGQAAPGQAQPIHIVRRVTPAVGAAFPTA